MAGLVPPVPPESFSLNAVEKAPQPSLQSGDNLRQDTVGGMTPNTKVEMAAATQKLVDGNVIPDLQLHENPADIGKLTPVAPKDWTVAIDLAASIAPYDSNKQGGGVERELPRLQALATETEGKSVNFLVHAERLVDENGNLCQQKDTGLTADCMNGALTHGEYPAMTERYFIHDGKIEKLPTAQYVDGGDDTQELLKEAVKLAPSKNLGLIIQSHGEGSGGVATNLGDVKLDDELAGIKKGLAGSGHEKLDLLDFNACDMAEARVIDRSSQVANDVVASSTTEFANKKNDGQNMPAAMHALLANSQMTGRQLGETMVKQAASGANGSGFHNGTMTLTNFDLTNYGSFKDKLNDFGAALGNVTADPANMKQIQTDIESTTVPMTGMLNTMANDRDLKTFAQSILTDSHAHKFSGDNKPLEDAASALVKSFDPLVTATFGDKTMDYNKLGGMTAYLPGNEILDTDKVVQQLSPLHQASEALNTILAANPTFADKQKVVDNFDLHLMQVPLETEKAFPQEAMKIIHARDAVEQSANPMEFDKATLALLGVMRDAEKGPMGQKINDDVRADAASTRDDYFKIAPDQLTPDWDKFIGQLQAQAK